MGDCLKMLRTSQRPIFHIISVIDGLLSSIKESGGRAGIRFVEVPPMRENDKVPKQLVNGLAIESTRNMCPLPDIPFLLDGLEGLSERDKTTLEGTADEIAKTCKEVSKKINDDFLAFYCDLYGHADACIRDILRSKLASCFKMEFLEEVLGRNLSQKNTGLLGGIRVCGNRMPLYYSYSR